jgi:hypothetical protein
MSAKSKKGKEFEDLPPGLSKQEEAEWWDNHKDYWDQIDAVDEVLGPLQVRRTAPVTNLYLPLDLIAALKAEAERRGLAYQSVIRIWLDERLAAEAQANSPAGTPSGES